MYAYIQGELVYKEPAYVIVDANGIGYEIRISLNTYSKLEGHKTCKLLTYLHVREDAQLLYGFIDSHEKRLFTDLIGISGVGPAIGLMMLSSMPIDEMEKAIAEGEVNTIQQIKGVGNKMAQKVIIELQDKMQKRSLQLDNEGVKLSGNTASAGYKGLKEEALSALLTLGMGKSAAEKNIEKVLKTWNQQTEVKTSGHSLEELIKQALKTT